MANAKKRSMSTTTRDLHCLQRGKYKTQLNVQSSILHKCAVCMCIPRDHSTSPIWNPPLSDLNPPLPREYMLVPIPSGSKPKFRHTLFTSCLPCEGCLESSSRHQPQCQSKHLPHPPPGWCLLGRAHSWRPGSLAWHSGQTLPSLDQPLNHYHSSGGSWANTVQD